MLNEYLSLEALAARLNLPQEYLRRIADEKQIPSLDVNGRLRFNEPDVRAALTQLADDHGQSPGRAERRSEPVHIREILPELMADIAARMERWAERE